MALKIIFLLSILISSTYSILYGEYVQDVRPFMAVLINVDTNEDGVDDGKYFTHCGGAIFSEYYVVTAAQCLIHANYPHLVGTDGTNIHRMRTYHKIIKKLQHPDYTYSGNLNDIGLVKTETAITNYEAPYSYPDNWYTPIFIYGWGQDDSGNMSDDLKQLRLLMVSDISPCSTDPYFNKGYFVCYITDNDKDRVALQDFGSPVIMKSRRPSEKNVILGVVSHYESAQYHGKEVFSMMAANYSHYYPWLAQAAN